MRFIFLLIVLILEALISSDTRAGWGTSCAPVRSGWATEVNDQVAWGRFRRRRWMPSDDRGPSERVMPAPATEPPSQGSAVRAQGSGKPAMTTAMGCNCKCGDACDCNPCQCGDKHTSAQGPVAGDSKDSKDLPTGVDWSKISPIESYTVDGVVVPRPDALKFVEGGGEGKVPDDSKLVRLTLCGPTEACKQVTDDLDKDPQLAAVKDRVLVQSYRPGDKTAFAVERAGFVCDGKPSIYVQAPDGKVLARMDHYPGPAVLASELTGAVRKVDPAYDPKKDPDPTKPLSGGLPLPLVILGAGAGLALLLKPKS